MSIGKRWMVVVLYTIFIFATLPFTRTWWNWVGPKMGYMGLIGLYCVSTVYIYYRCKSILIIGVFFVISITIFRTIQLPIERIHFIEYGLLGWMTCWAVESRKSRFFTALLFISLIGVLDEGIQWILPMRVFDWRDIWMNMIGGNLGLFLGFYARE